MNGEVITYRPALEEDLGAMALVLMRATAKRDELLIQDGLANHEMLTGLEQQMTQPNTWADVATERDKVVGFAFGYPYSDAKNQPMLYNTEYLSLLMVDPDYWGRHIASQLLDVAANHARNAGKRSLLLWTREANNVHTRTVYEHKGYVLNGNSRIHKQFGKQVQYLLDL